MDTAFSTALVRLRRQAGFKTPYAFYTRAGGRKVLDLSYVSYWNIEKGRLLPKPERLPLLVSCLRLESPGRDERELAAAYLKVLLGSESTHAWIMRALGSGSAQEAASFTEQAARRAVGADQAHLTIKQARALAADYAGYWGWTFLINSHSSWPVKAMAEKIGVEPRRLQASLKRLASHKLVKLAPDGRASAPLAGKHVSWPPKRAMGESLYGKMEDHDRRMAQAKGVRVYATSSLPRAQEPGFESYFTQLRRAVSDVHVYSHAADEPGRRSALYLVEGSVYRLFTYEATRP